MPTSTSPPSAPPPIYVGAVNEKMLELTGALADGVELGLSPAPAYVEWSWARIVAGAGPPDGPRPISTWCRWSW